MNIKDKVNKIDNKTVMLFNYIITGMAFLFFLIFTLQVKNVDVRAVGEAGSVVGYANINEFFYNEVVSGSYNDEKGMFSEEKLYNAHRQELYELHELDKTVTEDKEVIDNKFYVTSTLDKKSLFKKPSKGLIRQDRVLKGNYNDYIEKKIYPQILKDILVEDYIYRNNPISLGRSYATKVSYVKVAYDEDSQIPVRRLLKNFANTHVEQGEIDFEIISEAIKGFKDFDEFGVHTISDKAKTLLDATYGENDTICVEEDVNYQGQPLLASGQPFHKNSKIGELIESFNKAIKAEKAGRFPIEEDKAELDKFTTDGKSKEYGLMQKLIALAKEDYTTDGWFVKSSGAGELPSNITDRLFNIKVSQDIDKIPEEKDGPNEEYKTSYLRNVKGNKFVIAKDADKYENDQLNYIYDDGSSACWMAVVSEAVSPAKFNEKAETWLGKKENEHGTENRLEKIGRSVAEVLGTKSNYVKETYTEYLNEYKDFMFYDSALYDYFKSEYPDLDIFDEE